MDLERRESSVPELDIDQTTELPYEHPVAVEYLKFAWSVCLVLLSIIVICTGISNNFSVLQFYPGVLFLLLLASLLLLAYVEGLHYAVVSVERWDVAKYRSRFPRGYHTHSLVNTPIQKKKFLAGRQFFVIFAVFLIAQLTSFPNCPDNFLGMPSWFTTIFIKSGLLGVMLVLTFGQLLPELLCEEFTMQFLNMYGCNTVVRLALAAEYVGICHFSWFLYETMLSIFCTSDSALTRVHLQAFNDRMNNSADSENNSPINNLNRINNNNNDNTNSNTNSDEVKDGLVDALENELIARSHQLPLHVKELNWFDYLKYFWCISVTLGSIVVVIVGIFHGYSVFKMSTTSTYIMCTICIILLFYLEGLMVAIAGTQSWDRTMFRSDYPRAFDVHELVNKPHNVKRFMIGRQFCTVLICFLVAELTTFPTWPLFPQINPILHFILFRSGLVGVLIVLSFGQLMPELLAAEYPLKFMNIYGSYTIMYVSLLMETVGVGHCAWLIYYSLRSFLWF